MPESARHKFTQARLHARERGIGWDYTYDDWRNDWDQSGHWLERGPGPNQFCMSRRNDRGPYRRGNTEIVTNQQNWDSQKASPAMRRKMSRARKGRRPSPQTIAKLRAAGRRRCGSGRISRDACGRFAKAGASAARR